LSSSKESLQKTRVFENSHIIFWLLKDMSWAFGFKLLGMLMIFPTLFISIVVTYMLRQEKREWYHNNAVTCWIIANSYWMISEFYEFEDKLIFFNITAIQLAAVPFLFGLILIAYYYLTLIIKK
jgi:hypothetical protein